MFTESPDFQNVLHTFNIALTTAPAPAAKGPVKHFVPGAAKPRTATAVLAPYTPRSPADRPGMSEGFSMGAGIGPERSVVRRGFSIRPVVQLAAEHVIPLEQEFGDEVYEQRHGEHDVTDGGDAREALLHQPIAQDG